MRNKLIFISLLSLFLIATFTNDKYVNATVRVQSPSPKYYIGASSDTKPTDAITTPGSTFMECDTGRTYIYDGATWYITNTITYTALTDTFTTVPDSIIAISTHGYDEVTFTAGVLSMNFAANVRVEGIQTGRGWVNLDADNDSTIITANGNYGWRYVGTASLDSVRFIASSGTEVTFQMIIRAVLGVVK